MINPFKRTKEYIEYKRALKGMQIALDRQKEIPTDEDGGLSGDGKKLFDFYAMSFMVNAVIVTRYQEKYFHKEAQH